MNRKTLLIWVMLIPVVVVSAVASAASSNIDPALKHSWSENAGWMNWRDANGGADGVFVDIDFFTGFVWMENVGWLNVGLGGGPYANTDDTDFGVNVLPGGDLEGFAWGENIGWINFDTLSIAPNQARFDAGAGRFRGYAWAENVGWINLDDGVHFVSIIAHAPGVAPAPHDRRKNRYLSFAPSNGPLIVAFRLDKMTAPTGSCWVDTPDTNGMAKCVAAPVFRLWNELFVHVGDCEIVPVADYNISASADALVFTAPLMVSTIAEPVLNGKQWGDVSGPFTGSWPAPDQFTNVNDLLALLAYISNTPTKAHLTVVNIADSSAGSPCVPPQVNTGDVQSMVAAISAKSYGVPDFPLRTIDPVICPPCP